MEIKIRDERLVLHPEKLIFWPKEQAIILSDLHLGKAGHFRKHGIPIPASIHHVDLYRLEKTIQEFSPQNIYILGDLFHSDLNNEWGDFELFLDRYAHLNFFLIKGNHDILQESIYTSQNLDVSESMVKGPFLFTHIESKSDNHYNISGHIHPAVRMRGFAKQSLTLPCFFFASDHAYLPAFGEFTGSFKLSPQKKDKVYIITSGEVLDVNSQ